MDIQKLGYQIIYFYLGPLDKKTEKTKERTPLVKKIEAVAAYPRAARTGEENKGKTIDITA